MPRTYPEALEQLKPAIRAALLRRAPDYGRSVWEEDLAEEIQVHPNTIRNAIRAKGLLNAAALWCLCDKPPSPNWAAGFEREIYGKDYAPASADAHELAEIKAVLARLLDKDGNGRVVKLEGKIS